MTTEIINAFFPFGFMPFLMYRYQPNQDFEIGNPPQLNIGKKVVIQDSHTDSHT